MVGVTTSVEVAIGRDSDGVGIRAYTAVFTSLLMILEEVDRVARTQRSGRFKWGVQMVDTRESELIARLTPRALPTGRTESDVERAATALTDGVSTLAVEPSIPNLFTEQSVGHVVAVGDSTGRSNGLRSVGVATLNGHRSETAYIDNTVRDNGRKAVVASSLSYSSMVGVLDTMTVRRERPRIELFMDRGQAITCDVAALDWENVMDHFEHRVIISGVLKRNSRGQPVRMDATGIDPYERAIKEHVHARDLLGMLSTDGPSTADLVAGARRRGE